MIFPWVRLSWRNTEEYTGNVRSIDLRWTCREWEGDRQREEGVRERDLKMILYLLCHLWAEDRTAREDVSILRDASDTCCYRAIRNANIVEISIFSRREPGDWEVQNLNDKDLGEWSVRWSDVYWSWINQLITAIETGRGVLFLKPGVVGEFRGFYQRHDLITPGVPHLVAGLAVPFPERRTNWRWGTLLDEEWRRYWFVTLTEFRDGVLGESGHLVLLYGGRGQRMNTF